MLFRSEIDRDPVGFLVLQDGSDPFFSGHGIIRFILTNINVFDRIVNIARAVCPNCVSLQRIAVPRPALPAGSKGNPARIRDCARSCVIRNGSFSACHWASGAREGGSREKSEDLP